MTQDNRPPQPGARNEGRNNRRPCQGQDRVRQSRFEGREPRLQCHIYDWTGERTPDRYIRTTREIVNFVGTMYSQYTAEFTAAVYTLVFPDPEELEAPDPENHVQFELWKLDIKEHRAKIQEYSNFQSRQYNVVLGQCTEALLERLKSHEDFPEANQNPS